MKDPKRVWAWVGVAIIVIAVIVWVVWGAKPTTEPQAASGPAPVYAAQGQLVPQFPKGLILDSNAAISGSYSINYASSTNQYSADYDSSSTVSALYNDYIAYLPQNGWTLTGSLTTNPSFDVITAAQSSTQLQVVIDTASSGSEVDISYVVQ